MMITHIENINYGKLNNLSIEKLGHINLFSGKDENGLFNMSMAIHNEADKSGIYHHYATINHIFNINHYTDLKTYFRAYFSGSKQIFATTQRYDVIQAFAEVAQEYKDVEAYYYRLGRSAIPSDNNRSVVSMYTVDELIEAISKNREVR